MSPPRHCEEPVFWATWQSLVPKAHWGAQKRDCHAPLRGARNDRGKSGYRNDKTVRGRRLPRLLRRPTMTRGKRGLAMRKRGEFPSL